MAFSGLFVAYKIKQVGTFFEPLMTGLPLLRIGALENAAQIRWKIVNHPEDLATKTFPTSHGFQSDWVLKLQQTVHKTFK